MRNALMTLVVCLLGGATPLLAQSNVQRGVLGGAGVSTLDAKSDGTAPDFTSRAAISAGVFAVTAVRHGVAFEPEFLITVKGGKIKDGSDEADFRLTALEIPLLLRIASASNGRIGAHVLVGPSINVRLRARQITRESGVTTDEDISDQSRRGELALVAGAGIDVDRFRLDGRFTWGVTRLNSDDSGNFRIKSRTFAVLAGFRLW